MDYYCSLCGQCHSTSACPPTINYSKQNIPFKCPVCDGSGTVSRPPHIPGDVGAWPSSGSDCALYDCHACSGMGIVWSKGESLKKRKIKIRWTCSNYVHHEHRWKWIARLCGRIQKYLATRL